MIIAAAAVTVLIIAWSVYEQEVVATFQTWMGKEITITGGTTILTDKGIYTVPHCTGPAGCTSCKLLLDIRVLYG